METFDAYERAKQQVALKTLRQREWVVLAVFLIFALAVFINFKRVEVKGRSMEPTYYNSDMVIVWKTAPRGQLKPGNVIVFRSSDGDELIKRIAYIQPNGQAVHFPDWLTLADGRRIGVAGLFNPVNSPYFLGLESGRTPAPTADRTIYVLGDNLPLSNDSRDFGPISPSQILGKVIP